MYALMGMKLEERVDGQVNIGVAVCPTKPTAITAIAPFHDKKGKRIDMQTSNSSEDLVVVPKSAFIIRPPEHYQSQGRVSIAYAHQPRRPPSKFVITFNPQDQGHQDKITPQEQNFLNYQGSYITENMKQIDDKEGDMRNQSGVPKVGLVGSSEENVKKDMDENSTGFCESIEKQEAYNLSTSKESKNLTMPQHTKVREIPNLQATVVGEEENATGSRKEEASLAQTKRSSDMKRVSWVEDTERDKDKRVSSNSFKENKKESTRKSNGIGINCNNRSSSSKKQHGFSSAENFNSNSITEGCTKGGKRSSDKSRIPAIAGDYPPSCEFYRRQMLRECMYSPPTDNWYGYGGGTSIQKYAGQKVVEKIAAEQKRLEEDISNRRKTEIWILGGNETDDLIMPPSSLPLRKRTMRLKPMQFVQ